MNPSEARVIDPVLSNVALGYQNAGTVGTRLFPVVPVGQRGGKIIEFGKESFRLYATARAPGENTKRIRFGFLGKPYALTDDSLEGQVPMEIQEEALAVPGISMAEGAIYSVSEIMTLGQEKKAADIARNAANYGDNNKVTLSGTDRFSDYSSSKPEKVVSDAVEAIRAATGKRPNQMVLGPKVFAALKHHPVIIERIKYTGRESVTAELLAALFDIPNVSVGDAIYADDAGAFNDVWGKDIILGFTQVGTVRDRGLPSYGYTYQLENYPVVEEPYYDRSSKSWIYPVTRSEEPVLAAPGAGFLIKNAVA